MAELTGAQTTTNTQPCPICMENIKSPRSIPGCKHSFCEKCLFTFVFNLKEKGELGFSFECPVCRTPCDMNDSGEVTIEWIQTLPVYTNTGCIDSSDSLSEKEAEKQRCGSCLDEVKTVAGQKYCLDCKGVLCDECIAAHKRFLALKVHSLLAQSDIGCSLDIYKEVQSFTKCPRHPDYLVELYCDYHEDLMCLICATTSHKECKNIVELSSCSAINDDKTEMLKAKIEEAEKHISLLNHISEDNCNAVKGKIKSYRNDLQIIKDGIIKRLNEIVDNEHAITKQIIIDVEDKTFECTQGLAKLKALFKQVLSRLHSLQQLNLRPREVFVFVESLVADLEELDKQIYQSESEIRVAGVDLKGIGIMNSINERLVEDQIPKSSLEFQRPEDLPILESSRANTFVIEKNEYHIVRLVNSCSPDYRGITVRKDGVLILCDNCTSENCGFIVLYDPQYDTKQTFKLNNAYCATSISDTLIAVTVPDRKMILTLHCSLGMKSVNSISIKHTPKRIVALKDGKVAISWSNPSAFSISDISGPEIHHVDYFTEDTTGRKFKTFDNLAINEKRMLVIQPCTTDGAVYCFTFKQQPVFTYKNNLRVPKGVAVDEKSGCVFVCDFFSNCIHQVSATGDAISIIRHDTLKNPFSVCFDGQRNCLWVTNSSTNRGKILCYWQKKI